MYYEYSVIVNIYEIFNACFRKLLRYEINTFSILYVVHHTIWSGDCKYREKTDLDT